MAEPAPTAPNGGNGNGAAASPDGTVLPGETPPPSTVSIRHVNHFYGVGSARSQCLHDVNLELPAGQIVFLLGPSGCGKTTLLTLVGALRSLQEGGVRVVDRELAGLTQDELVEVRRRIGFIFQAHNLFESLTALQNVNMAVELDRRAERAMYRRAEDLLGQLGLKKRIRRKPESLSGGEKQRVAIARALVNRPKLILADEPTAALDAASAEIVMGLLKDLAHEEGCTVLMVTHDEKTFEHADRIVKMQEGVIVSDVEVAVSLSICEFLQKCKIFESLTPDTLSNVADQVTRQVRPAGEVIIRQGDVGAEFYVIRKGSVDVLVDEGSGPNRVATLQSGDHFGEMALISGDPRNATVVAKEETELYALNKRDFQAAMDQRLSLKDELLRVFSTRSRR